ncbi:MAG: hypothetical protein GY694_02445, partial [Gammaproteobacteria bacterium]|nr:hypothetical protein [Gammaproteobacteria bacterium]
MKRDSFSSTSKGEPTIIYPYSDGIYLRVKRQFMSVVAGLLTSIGVSSIFGGIDASRISTIDSKVEDLAAIQSHIVHDVELNSKDILVNRNMLNGMNDVTERLALLTTEEHFRVSSMLISILLEAEYSRIDDTLNQYLSIISAAQEHKFHPAVLSQSRAIRAFDSIKAEAELLGLNPVINNAQQLSQLSTDYIYTEDGI